MARALKRSAGRQGYRRNYRLEGVEYLLVACLSQLPEIIDKFYGCFPVLEFELYGVSLGDKEYPNQRERFNLGRNLYL